MVIDSNVYWLPERLFVDDELLGRFTAAAESRGGVTTHTSIDADTGVRRIAIEKPAGVPNLNYRQGDYTVERQLAALDGAGVDAGVLKVPGAQGWLTLDLCREFNDGMAEQSRLSGGRLIPLAVLPPDDDADTLTELARCFDELGFTGVQITTHYGADYLDSPRFAGFLSALDAHGATVYVHHAPTPLGGESLNDYTNLRRSYGRCLDQVTAIGRMLFGGVYERYPDLQFVHSMLGGGIFAFSEMLLPRATPADSDGRFAATSADLRETFARHVSLEMSHAQPWGAAQLRCAIEAMGADRVVYGSSYPVKPVWMNEGVQHVRALGLSPEDESLVLGGNAARLYGITDRSGLALTGENPAR